MKRTKVHKRIKRTRFPIKPGWLSVLEWKHAKWGACSPLFKTRRALLRNYVPEFRGEKLGIRNDKNVIKIRYIWTGERWKPITRQIVRL